MQEKDDNLEGNVRRIYLYFPIIKSRPDLYLGRFLFGGLKNFIVYSELLAPLYHVGFSVYVVPIVVNVRSSFLAIFFAFFFKNFICKSTFKKKSYVVWKLLEYLIVLLVPVPPL